MKTPNAPGRGDVLNNAAETSGQFRTAAAADDEIRSARTCLQHRNRSLGADVRAIVERCAVAVRPPPLGMGINLEDDHRPSWITSDNRTLPSDAPPKPTNLPVAENPIY